MKIQKNLKGMTLYEMIIAIAIFAIMTGILVGVGKSIDLTNKSTRNLKSRIIRESPYAANKLTYDQKTGVELPNKEIEITVDLAPESKSKLGVVHAIIEDSSAEGGKREETFDYSSFTPVTMTGKKYETNAEFVDKEANSAAANDIYSGLNLEFIDIISTTMPGVIPLTTTTTVVAPTPPSAPAKN